MNRFFFLSALLVSPLFAQIFMGGDPGKPNPSQPAMGESMTNMLNPMPCPPIGVFSNNEANNCVDIYFKPTAFEQKSIDDKLSQIIERGKELLDTPYFKNLKGKYTADNLDALIERVETNIYYVEPPKDTMSDDEKKLREDAASIARDMKSDNAIQLSMTLYLSDKHFYNYMISDLREREAERQLKENLEQPAGAYQYPGNPHLVDHLPLH